MPHITIECSKNVRDEIDVDKMLRAVHDAAIETGVFPPDGIRSRVHILKHYRVAESGEETDSCMSSCVSAPVAIRKQSDASSTTSSRH